MRARRVSGRSSRLAGRSERSRPVSCHSRWPLKLSMVVWDRGDIQLRPQIGRQQDVVDAGEVSGEVDVLAALESRETLPLLHEGSDVLQVIRSCHRVQVPNDAQHLGDGDAVDVISAVRIAVVVVEVAEYDQGITG